MTETQETISTWAVDTFGSAGTHASVTARALREACELAQLLARPDGEAPDLEVVMECADVAIVICRRAEREDLDFMDLTVRSAPYVSQRMPPLMLAEAAITSLARLLPRREGDVRNETDLGHLGAALATICAQRGFYLWDCVEKKMEINRKRKWVLDGHGHGQHAPEDFRHVDPSTG